MTAPREIRFPGASAFSPKERAAALEATRSAVAGFAAIDTGDAVVKAFYLSAGIIECYELTVAAAAIEREATHEALARLIGYAAHDDTCDVWKSHQNGRRACGCGFSAAVADARRHVDAFDAQVPR